MSEAEFRQLAISYYDQIDAFEDSFYNSSPDRRPFYKNTYKDYVNYWTGIKEETDEKIITKIKDYPAWHWSVRLWYWLINHEDYIKYQWIVYKQREQELKDTEEAIRMGWINVPLVPLVSKVSYDNISYLPQVSRLLLNQLNSIFEKLNVLWGGIMQIRFSGKKQSPSDKPIAKPHFSYDEKDEKKQTIEISERKSDFFEHEDDRIVHTKICGFLKLPPGTSLGVLRHALQKLNYANRCGRPAIELNTQLKQSRKRIALLVAECGSHLGRLSANYQDDSFKESESKDGSFDVFAKKAYALGAKEFDETSLQTQLTKAMEASNAALVVFKKNVLSGRVALSQKDVDQVCDYYIACGFFNTKPDKLKPEKVWGKAMTYASPYHPDKVIRTYKDENGARCDIASDIIEAFEDFYSTSFKIVNDLFCSLRGVGSGEVAFERCSLSTLQITKLINQGIEYRKLWDEYTKNLIEKNKQIGERRGHTAAKLKQLLGVAEASEKQVILMSEKNTQMRAELTALQEAQKMKTKGCPEQSTEEESSTASFRSTTLQFSSFRDSKEEKMKFFTPRSLTPNPMPNAPKLKLLDKTDKAERQRRNSCPVISQNLTQEPRATILATPILTAPGLKVSKNRII